MQSEGAKTIGDYYYLETNLTRCWMLVSLVFGKGCWKWDSTDGRRSLLRDAGVCSCAEHVDNDSVSPVNKMRRHYSLWPLIFN